jgi:hypothetical protein
VESRNTVALYDLTTSSFARGRVLHVAQAARSVARRSCNPTSWPSSKTCYGAKEKPGSQALAFDIETGKLLALIASAPPRATFKDCQLTIRVNTYSWEWSRTSPWVLNVQVVNGRLVTVSRDGVTDAEW